MSFYRILVRLSAQALLGIAVFLGSREEVERVTSYHQDGAG